MAPKAKLERSDWLAGRPINKAPWLSPPRLRPGGRVVWPRQMDGQFAFVRLGRRQLSASSFLVKLSRAVVALEAAPFARHRSLSTLGRPADWLSARIDWLPPPPPASRLLPCAFCLCQH